MPCTCRTWLTFISVLLWKKTRITLILMDVLTLVARIVQKGHASITGVRICAPKSNLWLERDPNDRGARTWMTSDRLASICLRLSPIWSDAAPTTLDVAPPTSIEAVNRLSHLQRFRSGPTKVRRPSMSHLRLRLRPLAGCRTSEGSDLDRRCSDDIVVC